MQPRSICPRDVKERFARWLRSVWPGTRRAGGVAALVLRHTVKRRRDYGFAGTGGRVVGSALVCAVVGIFVLEGISIEFPGIILGALGYYLGLTSQDRRIQILGITAAALNVISMVISGLSGLPQ